MQIERHPNPARAMMRRRLYIGVPLVSAGMIAVAGASTLGYYAMLAGGAAMALGFPFLGRAWNVWQGVCGEEAVDRALAGLDDRYRLLCNFCPEDKVGDADRVLFGPHGILLIEVKNYTRHIRIRGESWSVQLQSGRWKRIKSPFAQAKRCGRPRIVLAVPSGTVEKPTRSFTSMILPLLPLPPVGQH